jgi:hypothetical protein
MCGVWMDVWTFVVRKSHVLEEEFRYYICFEYSTYKQVCLNRPSIYLSHLISRFLSFFLQAERIPPPQSQSQAQQDSIEKRVTQTVPSSQVVGENNSST